MARNSKPKLDLTYEIRDANGATYTWGPNERSAANRAQGFTWREKIGEGFSDGSLNLSRRIDLDWRDLAVVNDFTAVGADGTTAYEGQIAANPRSVSDRHQHTVELIGHADEMRDQEFTEIIVDRDQSAWGPMSARRKAQILPEHVLFDPETRADPNTSLTTLSLVTDGAWVAPFKPVCEAWYDAGAGNTVRQLRWRLDARGAIVTTDPAWDITPNVAQDDIATGAVAGSDFTGATPGNEVTFIAATPGRFAFFQSIYLNTPSGGDGLQYFFDLSKVAVYGDNNLPQIVGDPVQPPGVLASDVLRYLVSKYCPKLDPSGIIDSSYVIQHLAYKDFTFPYDAALDLNKYHLWNFGVWEGRRVVFEPYDLTDYKWEIRTSDPGVEFSAQGPSTQDTFNAILVTYRDVQTGRTERISSDTHPELADPNPSNPYTARGRRKPKRIDLSYPATADQALFAGQLALEDMMRPKAPGAITVHGHVRDRAGNWYPAWRVRAGDTVALVDLPNDSPRLVTEKSWDDESKTLTLTLDAPASSLDALNDRLSNALQAAGLS